MKPLHVGLLVVGAAIAGALAVKMTEPPSLPLPARHAPAEANANPSTIRQPILKNVARNVAAVSSAASLAAPVASAIDTAPPPIYSEPRHTAAVAEAKMAPKVKSAVLPAARSLTNPLTKPAPFPAPPQQEPVRTVSANLAPPLPYRPSADPAPGHIPTIQQIEEPSASRQVTLERGTMVAVRVMEMLSSDRVSAGDAFSASLAEPLVIDGLIIAERGSRVDGRVVASARPSRINGRAQIQLALTRITTADGQRIAISTEPWSKVGAASGATQAGEIGGGAALGAIIGAIAGGGAGAAIGAGIGGGAGLGTAVATKARPVTVPVESVIRFRVNARATITERQL